MRQYEIAIIFDNSLEQEALDGLVEQTSSRVGAADGTVKRTDVWGRRKLAYEIQHHREGYYVIIEVAAEPGALDAVDRGLRLDDAVLRHKIIRVPDGVVARARPSDNLGSESASSSDEEDSEADDDLDASPDVAAAGEGDQPDAGDEPTADDDDAEATAEAKEDA